ncbi:uncharacterized protein MONOS_14433 [Monocercomonoides exilis]|uniref:uncharacterized protein n=1 Tax=Monocercomonoides exilis TaxID=2049356 RepID=UPI00355A13A3|nr:hypothetical protein MONOS_14433 [Monocercomonoides exilis]|eukprot:MONOS_14433.1-p1 / transcript=MONOS_14433.1 / gene=MONOS_14433 / organism=Monocercomonoides_exilis_PA203 / gene_product=unspecified product / transcript_product=unspecified product / location=Mono_scaffold01001:1897-5383(+) / protein_length=1096 / sequence_SO=supercontig / SO=protein_coding / is_pseudo=false
MILLWDNLQCSLFLYNSSMLFISTYKIVTIICSIFIAGLAPFPTSTCITPSSLISIITFAGPRMQPSIYLFGLIFAVIVFAIISAILRYKYVHFPDFSNGCPNCLYCIVMRLQCCLLSILSLLLLHIGCDFILSLFPSKPLLGRDSSSSPLSSSTIARSSALLALGCFFCSSLLFAIEIYALKRCADSLDLSSYNVKHSNKYYESHSFIKSKSYFDNDAANFDASDSYSSSLKKVEEPIQRGSIIQSSSSNIPDLPVAMQTECSTTTSPPLSSASTSAPTSSSQPDCNAPLTSPSHLSVFSSTPAVLEVTDKSNSFHSLQTTPPSTSHCTDYICARSANRSCQFLPFLSEVVCAVFSFLCSFYVLGEWPSFAPFAELPLDQPSTPLSSFLSSNWPPLLSLLISFFMILLHFTMFFTSSATKMDEGKIDKSENECSVAAPMNTEEISVPIPRHPSYSAPPHSKEHIDVCVTDDEILKKNIIMAQNIEFVDATENIGSLLHLQSKTISIGCVDYQKQTDQNTCQEIKEGGKREENLEAEEREAMEYGKEEPDLQEKEIKTKDNDRNIKKENAQTASICKPRIAVRDLIFDNKCRAITTAEQGNTRNIHLPPLPPNHRRPSHKQLQSRTNNTRELSKAENPVPSHNNSVSQRQKQKLVQSKPRSACGTHSPSASSVSSVRSAKTPVVLYPSPLLPSPGVLLAAPSPSVFLSPSSAAAAFATTWNELKNFSSDLDRRIRKLREREAKHGVTQASSRKDGQERRDSSIVGRRKEGDNKREGQNSNDGERSNSDIDDLNSLNSTISSTNSALTSTCEPVMIRPAMSSYMMSVLPTIPSLSAVNRSNTNSHSVCSPSFNRASSNTSTLKSVCRFPMPSYAFDRTGRLLWSADSSVLPLKSAAFSPVIARSPISFPAKPSSSSLSSLSSTLPSMSLPLANAEDTANPFASSLTASSLRFSPRRSSSLPPRCPHSSFSTQRTIPSANCNHSILSGKRSHRRSQSSDMSSSLTLSHSHKSHHSLHLHTQKAPLSNHSPPISIQTIKRVMTNSYQLNIPKSTSDAFDTENKANTPQTEQFNVMLVLPHDCHDHHAIELGGNPPKTF